MSAATPTSSATPVDIAQVIFEHAARIAQEQHIPTLLRLNADLARDLTGADRCSLWLMDEQTQTLWTRVAHGSSQEIRIPAGQGIVGASIAQDRTLLINNVSTSEYFFNSVDDASGYSTESVLCVPVRADGEVIGALQVLNAPGGFAPHHQDLLQFMAMYSASAIQAERLRKDAESARLLRHELDIARDVQQKLLRQEFAPVRGLEYKAFCRSARLVGGDYYDAFELPDGSFALALGDVSGKGMPAALLMAGLHALLRTLLVSKPASPAEVFQDLNRWILRNTSTDRYTTLFCGILDATRSVVTYVNGGHVTPIVVRQGHCLYHLSEGDPPVGLIAGVKFHQHQAALLPGDILVILSDGFVDVENAAGDEWTLGQVEAILTKMHEAPLGEIVAALLEATDRFMASSEQFDDMTVMVARLERPINNRPAG